MVIRLNKIKRINYFQMIKIYPYMGLISRKFSKKILAINLNFT